MKIAIKIINWLTIILSIIMIILAIAFIIMLGSSINTEMGLWIFALFFAQLLPYSFSLIIIYQHISSIIQEITPIKQNTTNY